MNKNCVASGKISSGVLNHIRSCFVKGADIKVKINVIKNDKIIDAVKDFLTLS